MNEHHALRSPVFPLFLVALLLAAVGLDAAPPKAGSPPVHIGKTGLLGGEFVESVDVDTALLLCNGIGRDMPEAIVRARQGCLLWFVNKYLAKSSTAVKAFHAIRKRFVDQVDRYVAAPPPSPADMKGKGVKSRVRLSEELIRVEIVTEIKRGILREDLVKAGVLPSTDGISVRVLVTTANRSLEVPLHREIEAVAARYLVKEGWEVVGARKTGGSPPADSKEQHPPGGAVHRRPAQLAEAAGADVYVVLRPARIWKDKEDEVVYLVGASAYETGTKKKISSEQAQSTSRPANVDSEELKAAFEAANDTMFILAMDLVGLRVRAAEEGVLYALHFRKLPKGAEEKIKALLGKNCSGARLLGFKDEVADFEARCRFSNAVLVDKLKEGMNAVFPGSKFDLSLDNRSIMVEFQ